MIVARTPLRVSFVGGGSDLPAWYNSGERGACLNTAISAYIYVCVSKQFDSDKLRVSYSITENVRKVGDLKHDLIRECCKMMGIESGIEINTIADVPGRGTGLGSSAAVTVGTLLALSRYLNKPEPRAAELASRATNIEMSRLKRPIGKQDQYAVAFGGLNEMEFHFDGVKINPVHIHQETWRRLNSQLFLYYTGLHRSAAPILASMAEDMDSEKKSLVLKKLVGLVSQARKALEMGQVEDFGYILNEAWMQKKELSDKISKPEIEMMYEKAMKAGAWGAKLLGAGAGGFLLVAAPRSAKDALTKALYREPLNVEYGVPGSMIVFDDGRIR